MSAFMRILRNGKWVATLPADSYVNDGQFIHLLRNGETVAVISSECMIQEAANMPGDPNVRDYGERKSIK